MNPHIAKQITEERDLLEVYLTSALEKMVEVAAAIEAHSHCDNVLINEAADLKLWVQDTAVQVGWPEFEDEAA